MDALTSTTAATTSGQARLTLQIHQQGIVSLQACRRTPPGELTTLFAAKIEEFKEAYQTSQLCLHQSQPYGRCLLAAETAIFSLHNIRQVLTEQRAQASVEDNLEQLDTLESDFKEMKARQPEGETVLLPSDLLNLQRAVTLPQNQIYEFEGKVYHEPKISHGHLGSWFSPFYSRGKYRSLGVSLKLTAFYQLKFDTPLTAVFLRKDDNQKASEKKLLEAKYQQYAEPLQTESSNKFSKAISTLFRPAKKDEKIKAQLETQQQILQEITLKLPKAIVEKEWGFESFKVLSSEELVKEWNVSIENAVDADVIFFFHMGF